MPRAIMINDEQYCIEWLSGLSNTEFAEKVQLIKTSQTVNEEIKLISNFNKLSTRKTTDRMQKYSLPF